jgi:hypothetical protein
MLMMKLFFILTGVALLLLCGCQADSPVCPPAAGTPHYLTLPPDSIPTPLPGNNSAPTLMNIGGRNISIDKIVEGPLCNDTWSGTVYVTCDVQVFEWVEQPTFLKNCDLTIAPDTVVYVAYHNDAAYYNGCSCHTGETAEP